MTGYVEAVILTDAQYKLIADRDAQIATLRARCAALEARARDAEIWRDRNYTRIAALEGALREWMDAEDELAFAPTPMRLAPTPHEIRRQRAKDAARAALSAPREGG